MHYRTVPGWLIPFLLGMSVFGLTFFTGPAAADRATASAPKAGVQAAPPIYMPLIFKNYAAWLDRVNTYRRLAQLPDLTENPDWSFGARQHAVYMVKAGETSNFESMTSPWYTPDGAAAAPNSLLIGATSATFSDVQAVDYWFRSPFQTISILDPELRQTGYGSYREAGGLMPMAAALDVRRGYISGVPAGVTFPVKWPGSGQVVGLRTFAEFGETPDSFSFNNCNTPGYSAATAGLPIILQVGSGSAAGPTVNRNSAPSVLRLGSSPQPHCLITAVDLPVDTAGTRDYLATRDALILIPKDPLMQGATYTVSITATLSGGSPTNYTWSFSVAANANP